MKTHTPNRKKNTLPVAGLLLLTGLFLAMPVTAQHTGRTTASGQPANGAKTSRGTAQIQQAPQLRPQKTTQSIQGSPSASTRNVVKPAASRPSQATPKTAAQVYAARPVKAGRPVDTRPANKPAVVVAQAQQYSPKPAITQQVAKGPETNKGIAAATAASTPRNTPVTAAVYNEERRRYNPPRRGHQVAHMPAGHRMVHYHGYNYGYHHGVFYRPVGNCFVVAPPPFGIRVHLLPPVYYTVFSGPVVHYYYEGIYYNRIGNEYEVVAPPIGARVPALPAGCTVANISGMKYYEYEGTYYQEIILGDNELWYEVVGKG